jgi:hypothetical protein
MLVLTWKESLGQLSGYISDTSKQYSSKEFKKLVFKPQPFVRLVEPDTGKDVILIKPVGRKRIPDMYEIVDVLAHNKYAIRLIA